jgi:hypothetical protein
MKTHQTTIATTDALMQFQTFGEQASIYWVSTHLDKKLFYLMQSKHIKDEIIRLYVDL